MATHRTFRRTKIVCTIGPATQSPEQISKLIAAGMDVARLNFSHGDHNSHLEAIRCLRRISAEQGREIGILQDLGGPKIRLGTLPVASLDLERGQRVWLSTEESSDPQIIPVHYPYLVEDVAVGDRLLLADGTVELTVKEKRQNRLLCTVAVGGAIQSHKGINLPSSTLRIPAFTDKDRQDLLFGLEHQVDFVALSFVRSEKDLQPVHEIVDALESRPLLIAKIEKPQAVARLEEIVKSVDGVMVARGDLGVEMPLEEVPMIQKRIIATARRMAKPVITATQMLRSMMDNPRPTRAEATDVANAVLDGTDAVMLSDETAVGSFPIEAVTILDRLTQATEPYLDDSGGLMTEALTDLLPATAAAISRAAGRLIIDLRAAAVVASTSSGSTARLVACFRPCCPIVGLTPHVQTLRQLTLSWGVMPDLIQPHEDTDAMFSLAREWVLKKGIAGPGDRIIVTAGVPLGIRGTTNLVKVMEI